MAALRSTRVRWLAGAVLLVAMVLGTFIVAGGGSDDPAPNARRLDSRDYDADVWPLTVSSGIVRCEESGAVTFQPTGGDVRYAINEAAQGLTELPELFTIWKRDPENNGLRVDISPVVEPGLDLC